MRAAEGGKEVVQSDVIGQVGDRQLQGGPDAFGVEEVVRAGAQVEEVPRRDARRIVVVVARSRGGDASRVAP